MSARVKTVLVVTLVALSIVGAITEWFVPSGTPIAHWLTIGVTIAMIGFLVTSQA